MTVGDRIQHAWNAFMNKDPTPTQYTGPSYTTRPDRPRFSRGNERSVVTAIYNRLSIDSAAIDVRHVMLDSNGRFLEEKDSRLNECLSVSANIDQTGRALLQDIVMSMLDEGVVAVVPVKTTKNPNISEAFDIGELRTGKIVEWKSDRVKVRAYNELTGRNEEAWFLKRSTAIIENPFYSVMNEPNSTAQRLIRKLNILDNIDERTGSNRLDVIIQLPYAIKSEARRQQAESRRKDIEMQLSSSSFGVAYTDATEHIVQLNRSVENQIMGEVEYLTHLLYSQLGLTIEIMNGTADDAAMNNYYSRTIEPILSAIVDEMKRKFLTKTARTQGQSIEFFRDPFKLVLVSQISEIADKFTRNEIMTSNEIRQVVGMKPSSDPRADELRNKNLSEAKGEQHFDINGEDITEDYDYEEPQ